MMKNLQTDSTITGHGGDDTDAGGFLSLGWQDRVRLDQAGYRHVLCSVVIDESQ